MEPEIGYICGDIRYKRNGCKIPVLWLICCNVGYLIFCEEMED